MSLLSLLIALAAEKSLSSPLWHFDFYFQQYKRFFENNSTLSFSKNSTLSYTLFLLLPVIVVYVVLDIINDGFLYLIISTMILIICFGCSVTRKSYKEYLQSAFRGEKTTSELYHQQLLQDKNLPPMGFAQALIWLNYRYYIAIMLFFVVFGATGVVFYRLLTTVIEQQNGCSLDTSESDKEVSENQSEAAEKPIPSSLDALNVPDISSGCRNYHDILFYLDWLPVRITSFGYMFVGHFSHAFPVWVECLFDFKKPTFQILTEVAQKSEDSMIDNEDCTAEPCLLVRLAKRNVLLILAVTSFLTLIGMTH